MLIRDVRQDDAPRLLEIYAWYVEHTAVTFDEEIPAPEAFAGRMKATAEKYPFLVAEDGGAVQGYAYAGPFVGRSAYRFSCETTIYLAHDARRRGYGRALYEALEERLKAMGILNLYACIGDPVGEDEFLTRDSERFHRCLGYAKIGTFRRCGYKFGRWYNMIWMEKLIGEHR